MLPTYFDYIFVYLRQKVPLKSELSPKLLSTLCPNPTRKARPDLQDRILMRLGVVNDLHERSRRPTASKSTNNIREIEKIVREDRRLSIRLIAERMSIDKETLWQVVPDNMHMIKICAQVVSKFLTSDQKEKRREICANILKQIEENPKFLDSVITVPAIKDDFSSTTPRQRGSACIGKLQTHHGLRKQNQLSRQCWLFFLGCCRVLFFLQKSEWNAVLMLRENTSKGKQNKMTFFSSIKLLFVTSLVI